ncbi:MAG: indolepyruvate oxidoreductase subunit beta [Chloroflexi bacterium]|nr:indolepyruvate oxidoreductase subunit beta [Chloroflexota bacterium]
MKESPISILICGVGGQGTILARKIICEAFFNSGYDVKASEVHGMAQRGGSVVTHFRAGEDVASPLIEDGQADIILAFEPLEALRFLPKLKRHGQVIVNSQKIMPTSVLIGEFTYPTDIFNKIQTATDKIKIIDALDIATKAGNTKVVNVVLIGVLAKMLSVSKELWLKAVAASVPLKYQELNIKAFELGYNI